MKELTSWSPFPVGGEERKCQKRARGKTILPLFSAPGRRTREHLRARGSSRKFLTERARSYNRARATSWPSRCITSEREQPSGNENSRNLRAARSPPRFRTREYRAALCSMYDVYTIGGRLPRIIPALFTYGIDSARRLRDACPFRYRFRLCIRRSCSAGFKGVMCRLSVLQAQCQQSCLV